MEVNVYTTAEGKNYCLTFLEKAEKRYSHNVFSYMIFYPHTL